MSTAADYYDRKTKEAKAWRKILAYALVIEAPDCVLRTIRVALERAEYTAD